MHIHSSRFHLSCEPKCGDVKRKEICTRAHTHGGCFFFSPFFCASSGEVKRMNVLPDGASEVWKRELLKRAGVEEKTEMGR